MNRSFLAALFTILLAVHASAQKPPEIELGFKPDKVYSFGTLDNVNLFNGNLVFTIPVGLRYPVSSQMSYGLTLVYNSKAWDFWYEENQNVPGETAAWAKPNIRSNAGMGWRLSLGRLIPPSDYTNIGYTSSYGTYWIYEGPGGDEHELGGATATMASTSHDGSNLRMRYVDATHREIDFPNGEVHRFAFEHDAWRLRRMTDVGGNVVSVDYTYVTGTDETSTWTISDGHGRQHLIHFRWSPLLADSSDRGRMVESIVMRGYGTSPATVTWNFNYADTVVDYSCGHTIPQRNASYPTGPTSLRPTVPLLKSITLPDGSKWAFDYYTTTGSDCASGLLRDVTLPTLGTMSYTYQPWTIPANDRCQADGPGNSAPGVKTRTVGGNTWTYLQTLSKPTPFIGEEYKYTCGDPSPDGEQNPYMPKPIYRWKRTSVIAPAHNGSERMRSDHYFSIWRTAHLEQDEVFNAHDQQLFSYGYATAAAWPGTTEAAKQPVAVQATGDEDAAANPFDPATRYVQDQTWNGCTEQGDCSVAGARLLRTTSVRYRNFVVFPSVLRHPSSERVVDEDDDGCGASEAEPCYSQTDYADWDGLGHMRTVSESGNYAGETSAETYTGYLGIAVHSDPSRKWLTGRYTEQKRTMGSHRSRSLFHFDALTGLLTRRRTLTNGMTQSTTDLHEEYQYTGGNLTRISSSGGDHSAFATQPGSSDDLFQYAPPAAVQYRTDFSWASGALQSEWPADPASGAALQFKTRDYVRHAGTGLVVTSKGTDGLSTAFTYTPWGTPASATPPGEVATSYVYAPATATTPAKVTMTRSDSTVIYEYDGWGRAVREQRTLPGAGCVQKTSSFDVFGRVRQESTWHSCSAPSFGVTYQTYAYDGFGRITESRSPDGHVTTATYTGRRLVERTSMVQTPTGSTAAKTTEEYDRFGRLISVTENAGAADEAERYVTSYEYDEADRLRKVTMGTQTRLFTYDGRGFLTAESHPEHGGNSIRYRAFDARGHAGRRTIGADGSTFDLLYKFDAAERPILVSHSSERPIEQYAYDKSAYCPDDVCNGKIAAAARFHYDPDLANTAAGESLAVTESYKYDLVTGRPIRRDRTIGNTSLFTGGATFYFDQTWNNLGAVSTLSYPCVAPATCSPSGRRSVSHTYTNGVLTGVGTWASSITYAPSGMIATVSHGSNGAAGVEVWTADPFGLARPSSITAKNSANATLWSTGTYSYDGSGNITSIGSQQFAYDAMQRLVRWSETQPGGGSSWTSRAYDRYGNALHDSIGFCGPNGTRCGGTMAMTRAVTGTSNRYADTSYDAAGNVTSDIHGRSLLYDSGNVMTRAMVGGRDYRYLYSADGERIAAIERVNVGGTIRNKTTYTIRGFGNQLLSIWQSDPSTGALTWREDDIWRGSQLLAREHVTHGTSHYFLDHLGSPRAVTSATGLLRGVQDFDPFGNGGTSDGSTLQFTGHERDAATLGDGTTSLPDYMHARYYDVGGGRFLSVDPVLNVKRALRMPQNWNRYSYVMNNPLKYTDPTGEDVSIRLRFQGDGWTDEEKKKIIAQVTSWYQNQNVGKVYVFDGAKASHGGNFFTRLFSGGYTSIAVTTASGPKHTAWTVFAGNYSALSGAQRINAISNSIIHETVAHHFRATLANATDYRWYNRKSAYGWYTAISSRYGTVADSWAYAERATRGKVINGPIPIHPEDRTTLQQKLRDEEVEPPDYDQ